jgi:hypothetical protein
LTGNRLLRVPVVASLAALLPLALGASAARADADPASDFLLSTDVFYPFSTKVSGSAKSALDDAVASAKQGGMRVKVAIIANPSDLGSVTVLYRKPQPYSEFLGKELFYVNQARVLVVMPNGYGLWRKGGALSPRELNEVHSLPAPSSTDGNTLAQGANTAVRRLLALHGIRVTASGSGNNTTTDRLTIAAAALVVIVIGAAASVLLRRRGRTRAA